MTHRSGCFSCLLLLLTGLLAGALSMGPRVEAAPTPTPGFFSTATCPRPARTIPVIDWILTPGPAGTPVVPPAKINPATGRGMTRVIASADLPSGPPASAETIAAINQTLSEINGCIIAPSDTVESYFSDDFFRRMMKLPHENATPGSTGSAKNASGWSVYGFSPTEAPPAVVRAWTLPDGRIGAIVKDPNHHPLFFVFVKSAKNGEWQVDENAYLSDDDGTPISIPNP